MLDHPIFLQSIQFIRGKLGPNELNPLEQQVLERLIHTSGDFSIEEFLQFSPGACEAGLRALQAGSLIVTDTSMAKEAIMPMSKRTINTSVINVLNFAPDEAFEGLTRTAIGMEIFWTKNVLNTKQDNSPIVVIGSSPSSLEALLDLVSKGFQNPSLIIGMPVGFIGVEKSKKRLSKSNIPYILLNGTRGGAALAASAINALMRAAFIE